MLRIAKSLFAAVFPVVWAGAFGPLLHAAGPKVPTPATAVRDYSPKRLGETLVFGDDWQDRQAGSDAGFASLTSAPYAGLWSDGDGKGVTSDVLALTTDPHGHFGKVVKINNPVDPAPPPQFKKTAQLDLVFDEAPIRGQPQDRVWVRIVMLYWGENTNGPKPTSGGPYPAWFSTFGTGIKGGSTTYKQIFLSPKVKIIGPQNQFRETLVADGWFQSQFSLGVETTALPQGGAPVPPQDRMTCYAANEGVAPHDMRGTRDWYEHVLNYEKLGPSEYIGRHFIRRLTVNGAWQPWKHPIWLGRHCHFDKAPQMNKLEFTGNKSQTQNGPNPQYILVGPFEITNHPDPYGWKAYGR